MVILIDIRLIVTIALSVRINCSTVLKNNGTAGKDLNAQTLIELGRELNDPLVTIIGKVIENFHTCTAWSQWNECGATRLDFFSTRTRTRQCGKDRSGQGGRAEIETGVCEGSAEQTRTLCPKNYNMTANGFCIRLYTTGKSHDDAINVCKNDGGFLINIDSDKKYADVKSILTANDITSQIQIDGRRKTSTAQWEYTNGSGSGYFHWYSGYPNTGDKLCLRLSGARSHDDNAFRTYQSVCDNQQPFLCEVPV